MATDALTYSILTREIKDSLQGGKITKIIQPERDEVLLNIYNDRKNYKLVLSVNPTVCRMHITESDLKAPLTAPAFCMLLRKYLLNATIINVTNQSFERVADYLISCTDDLGYQNEKHLIIELTGKTGNIILTDNNYIILDTIKKMSLDTERERQFFPGTKYSFFPQQNKVKPNDIIALKHLIENSENPVYTLETSVYGTGKETINEILYGLGDNAKAFPIAAALERFNEYMRNLEQPVPNILLNKNGDLIDVFPIIYRSKPGEKLFFESLNAAFDYYYREKDGKQRFREKARHISTIIKNAKARTEKKIALQTEAIENSRNYEQQLNYGNLILSNLYKLKKGMDSFSTENFYEENQIINIILDPTLTPQQNAQKYFKGAAKMKNTMDYTEKMLAENKETLQYLISVSESLRYSSDFSDLEEIYKELLQYGLIRGNQKGDNLKNSIKKQSNNKINYTQYCVDGFDIFVGKNNTQNDYVTNKLAIASDTWLHAKNIHSAHVIIHNYNDPVIPDNVLLFAAEITAYFSEAQNTSKADIDYTLKKYVKKPSKAPLGFVIYTNQSTITVKPCEHKELLKSNKEL